jgi:hypothetical protein
VAAAGRLEGEVKEQGMRLIFAVAQRSILLTSTVKNESNR